MFSTNSQNFNKLFKSYDKKLYSNDFNNNFPKKRLYSGKNNLNYNLQPGNNNNIIPLNLNNNNFMKSFHFMNKNQKMYLKNKQASNKQENNIFGKKEINSKNNQIIPYIPSNNILEKNVKNTHNYIQFLNSKKVSNQNNFRYGIDDNNPIKIIENFPKPKDNQDNLRINKVQEKKDYHAKKESLSRKNLNKIYKLEELMKNEKEEYIFKNDLYQNNNNKEENNNKIFLNSENKLDKNQEEKIIKNENIQNIKNEKQSKKGKKNKDNLINENNKKYEKKKKLKIKNKKRSNKNLNKYNYNI